MIRYFILLSVIVFVSCDTSSKFASPDANYFVKYFGGDGNQFGVDMKVDTDGSIYILGNSSNSAESANQQIYLAKATAKGLVEWEKRIGKVQLEAKDLEFTSDGNLILVANMQNATSDVLVMRFDKQGNKLDSVVVWSKVLKSNDNYENANKNEYVNSITELKNGYFILIGYTDNALSGHTYDVMNIQLDKSLKKMAVSYNENNGSGLLNSGAKLIQNRNSLYIFGSSNFVSKTSTDSDIWTWTIDNNGYPNYNTDLQTQFIKTGYDDFVTNAVKSFTGYGVCSISSLNSDLTLRVIKISGDSLRFNAQDIAAIKEFSLGTGSSKFAVINNGYGLSNYFVASTYYPAGSATSDIMLMKLDDQNLNESWKQKVFFGGVGDDTAAAVEELPDGKILILGTMQLGNPANQYKIALIKVNADGKLQD